MGGIWILPIQFDILDALVTECLPGYAPGFVDFTREEITGSSVVYRLWQAELGDLGEIRLRKISEKESELYIGDPPQPPGRRPTPEELDAIRAMPSPEERFRGMTDLQKQISAERDELYRRRREHHRKVIQALFSRMEHDPAWEAVTAHPEEVIKPHGWFEAGSFARRENMDWDVFISHAGEDKESFARPLAKELEREGLRVWFAEFTLTVGDSLRRSIDRGLANSRYGIVILSPNFFAKEWPQKELDGLAAREVSGEKVILPVWHNISADQIREYSPILADRIAVPSDRGLERVVAELLRAMQPAVPTPEATSFVPPARPTQIVRATQLDLTQQEVVRQLGRGPVQQVIPLEDYLAVVVTEAGVGLFDLGSIQMLWEYQCPAQCGALNPDGSLLAVGAEEYIYLWDVRGRQLLRRLEGHTSEVRSVAFSPDGATLASGSIDKSVKLWRVEDGALLRTLQGHTRAVVCVAFSPLPDRTILASGSNDEMVQLWLVPNGLSLRTLEHACSVRSVAFSPSGTTLASGSADNAVRLWRVEDGALLHTLRQLWPQVKNESLRRKLEYEGWVNSVAFSPDGAMLASGSGNNYVLLWRLEDGTLSREMLVKDRVHSVAFSPDGQTLASGSRDGTVRLWWLK